MAEITIEEVEHTQRITSDRLTKIIQENDATAFERNRAYFEGKNVEIINKRFDGTPDNRIPLPFARRTVKDVVGYAYKPGNVEYVFTEETEDAMVDKLHDIFKKNDESLVSGEIFEDALVNGEGAELIYFNDDEVHLVQVPREQCIFEYKDQIKPELEFSVRYYTIVQYDDNGAQERINKADVHWPEVVEHYATGPMKITAKDQQKERQGTTTEKETYKFKSVEDHGFKEPTLYPYRIASDKLGVFQPYLKIIDILDDFGSDKVANALQKFADDFIVMSKKLDPAILKLIQEHRLFENMGPKKDGNYVEFLKRDLDIISSVEGFKLYERLYYDLIGIPNLNDDKFEAKSGIAMLYALIPFENLVAGFEVYFNKGLQHRLRLINNILGTTDTALKLAEAEIKWTRNLPADIDRTVENVVKLKESGLFSDETLFKFFPSSIVEDAAAEIERREAEKAQRVETALTAEINATGEELEK